MAHPHNIADRDPYFVIDPVTRAIVNKTNKKITLMQYDHNSERFTFEIPRMIEGHDMSLCDRIEVHYLNVETATKNTNYGVYEVTDAKVEGTGDAAVVTGSWLISQNATQLVGNLSFIVRYACTANDGTVVYVWSSAIYSSINVSDGIYNSEAIVLQYADVLEQWKIELERLARAEGATEEFVVNKIRDAINYLEDHDIDYLWTGVDTLVKRVDGIDAKIDLKDHDIDHLWREVDTLVERVDGISSGGGSGECGCVNRVFVSDTMPEDLEEGDVWVDTSESDTEPFVTASQMQDYVDDAIADALAKIPYAEEVEY